MEVTDGTREVTGDLTPDGTGKYAPAGIHNGKTYYRRKDGTYFIWWDGALFWYISIALGIVGAGWWIRADPAVDGDYNPGGAYLGNPLVTEI